MRRLLAIGAGLAALAACTTSSWPRLQSEFAEVAANCRISEAALRRDASDNRLLHLVFAGGAAAEVEARGDGRFACVAHWAHENGYRLAGTDSNGPRT